MPKRKDNQLIAFDTIVNEVTNAIEVEAACAEKSHARDLDANAGLLQQKV